MNFDECKSELEVPRMLIATEMCKGMLAHGNCGTLEEVVNDAYRFADEILKQGISQNMSEADGDLNNRIIN
jgi:hypothetical protein